jgi:TPP-dependent pyruvate/acetoin dehydrogenase alpha subunit
LRLCDAPLAGTGLAPQVIPPTGTPLRSVGDEAVALGVYAHLTHNDYITNRHCGHGHCIAKGIDIEISSGHAPRLLMVAPASATGVVRAS